MQEEQEQQQRPLQQQHKSAAGVERDRSVPAAALRLFTSV